MGINIYKLFFQPGEVAEIRGIGLSGKNPGWEGFAKSIVSGCYNDPEAFDKGAAILDRAQASGVYFTINPISEALLARAANRLKVPKSTTQDPDVTCIRWLPVDLDPRRPADISATDEEVARAVDKGKEIAAWLESELGFAKGIRAESGNGFHLLYRLPDLPNDAATHKLIVDAMAAIKARFDDDRVDIDPAVVNPSRIWKCYPTTGRKGDSTKYRPYRASKLFPKQPTKLDDVPITDLETLKKLAALVPCAQGQTGGARPIAGAADTTPKRANAGRGIPPAPVPAAGATRYKKDAGPVKMDEYLDAHADKVGGYNVKQKGAQTLYILDKCLFNPDHGPGHASIITSPSGPLLYQCFHASCKDKLWKDARAAISGNKPIAQWCVNFDPNYKKEQPAGTGILSGLQVKLYPDLLGPGNKTVLPHPDEIEVAEFFEIKNNREVFSAQRMAYYLIVYLSLIVCTDGFFWRYKTNAGLWEKFPKNKIKQYIARALKQKANATHIENALTVLTAIINREEAEWPDHPEYINLLNGTFDVNTMTLMPHNPDFGCRTLLPVNYTQGVFSQLWEDFLKDIFPDDENYEKRGLLMQFFGYCLLRNCKYEQALFCYGTGANGKSTVINVLTRMVGEENTSALTLTDMGRQFRTQLLQEKLVNMASETNLRDPVATETLKQAITGDMITVERKHGPPYSFRPYAKFLISMNDSPVIPDKSHGFARRIAVLGFHRRISKKERDVEMAKKIFTEIDGVFNWAVDGLRILIKNNGFVLGEKIEQETERMMETLNPLLIFVNEMGWIRPGEVGCLSTDAWTAYAAWCHDGKNRPLGRNKFFDQIIQTFPKVEKKRIEADGDQNMRFIGFGLTEKTMDWLENDVRRRGKERSGWGRDKDEE